MDNMDIGIRIVRPEAVRQELSRWLKEHSLIPILGAGFTCHCPAWKGQVPNGSELKECIVKTLLDPKRGDRKEDFEGERLQSVADFYEEENLGDACKKKNELRYLRHNFTHVIIEQEKRQFLSIDWPYVYTLNIDDAIETNSRYQKVLNADEKIRESIYDDKDCVIKLHGDVGAYLKREDAPLIFSTRAYLHSLRMNEALLKRFQFDLSEHQILYIGCSLDNELDLLYETSQRMGSSNIYYCGKGKPSRLDQRKLRQQYDVSTFLSFDEFEDIYRFFCDLSKESAPLIVDEWEGMRFREVRQLPAAQNDSGHRSYILLGAALKSNHGSYTAPYFFIEREATKRILTQMESHPIVMAVGSSCSGKSYLLVDLARHIKKMPVYLFGSHVRLAQSSFDRLLRQKDRVFLFDDGSLTTDQMEQMFHARKMLKAAGIRIVLLLHKSNKEARDILHLWETRGELKPDEIPMMSLSGKFTELERKALNDRLLELQIPAFDETHTILDNLLDIETTLLPEDRGSRHVSLQVESEKELAALIVLATKGKVYTSYAFRLELKEEYQVLMERYPSIIDREVTWPFEKSPAESAGNKYVINAEHWLYRNLGRYIVQEEHHDYVLRAYDFLLQRLTKLYGKPDADTYEKDAPYKPYMMVDQMNRIYERVQMSMIRDIFETMNPYLHVDPHYLHQKAKCYLRSLKDDWKDSEQYRAHLKIAYDNANAALSVFQQRYEKKRNEKVFISLAHATYTKALVLCLRCREANYQNANENEMAITTLYAAAKSEGNSVDMARKDGGMYWEAVYGMVLFSVRAQQEFPASTQEKINELWWMMREARQNEGKA